MLKMNIYKRILTGLFIVLGLVSCNQHDGTSKILLNEVLTDNAANFEDDYGIHSAWIEVFNKSYNSV